MSDDSERFQDFFATLERSIDEGLDAELAIHELQPSLKDAWSKDARPALDSVSRDLKANWEARRPALQDAALTDRELRLKLDGFFTARRRWEIKRDQKTFGSLLGWAQIIIGSLLHALPLLKGLLELLKEFLEALDRAVEDAE